MLILIDVSIDLHWTAVNNTSILDGIAFLDAMVWCVDGSIR